MKKILWVLLFLSMAPHAMACDICGFYLGIQPHDRTSSFGLYYRYRLLEGDMTANGFAKHGDAAAGPVANDHYKELYQVVEFRADMWLRERWAVMVSLPMANNYQSLNGRTSADVYGMSDPLVLGRYLLANTRCLSDSIRTVHRVLLGGGVKMPLGRTTATYRGAVVEGDLQPGTGSWDLLFTAEYLVRHDRVGLSTNAIARYNGRNSEQYALGNGLSNTTELFLRMDGRKLSWVPSVGVYMEFLTKDLQESRTVEGTGGSTIYAHLGSRVWWRSWVLSANYQYALGGHMGALMVPNRERLILGIAYNLNNN